MTDWKKQKTEIKENLIYKTWEVNINTDFYGVIYFLTELLKIRPPVLIKKIDISNKKEAFHDSGNQKKDLEVIIQITEILPLKKSITDEQ